MHKKKRLKWMLSGLIIIFYILLSIFLSHYDQDFKWWYHDYLKSDRGLSIEKSVVEKASGLIGRLEEAYLFNNPVKSTKDYFDKKCIFVLKGQTYTYKDVIANIKDNAKERETRPDQVAMLKVRAMSSSSTFQLLDEGKIQISLNGKLRFAQNSLLRFGNGDESKELDYKYMVTFEKKWWFIWRAIAFESESDIVERLLVGTFISDIDETSVK